MKHVVRASATMALTLCALLASPIALAADSGDILLVSFKGEVYVTKGGVKQAVSAGSVLDPPATLRTGRDGAVELRQGATTLSVGAETLLEFPALEKRGAPIDRIGPVAVSKTGHGNGHGNGNQGAEVTVDLGVDLGVDVDTGTTPVTDTTDTDKPGHGPPADDVELLDGLVRRRGKK